MRIGLDLGAVFPAGDEPPLAVTELIAELMRQAEPSDEVVVFVPDNSGTMAWRVRDRKLHQVETPFGAGRSADLWRALSFPAVERLSAGPDGPRLGSLDVCHSLEPPLMPSRARRRVVTLPALDGLSGALRRSLRRADDVLVTSESLRDALFDALRTSRTTRIEDLGAKVRVVHPGVHSRFASAPKASAIETLCTQHPFLEQPYLLGIGLSGLDDPGAIRLLEAWARARHEAPDLPNLVLALPALPTNEAIEAFLSAVDGNPQRPAIVEVPAPELLPALYRGAEMVLHPARQLRFGRAVAEAAAAGVPTVVGSGCGVLELLDGSAVAVDNHDPAAWTAAIRTLHVSPEERARRAELGRAPAQRTSWSTTATRLWQIYRAPLPHPIPQSA